MRIGEGKVSAGCAALAHVICGLVQAIAGGHVVTQETRWRALVALHVLVLAGTAHALTIEVENARIRTVGAAGLVFRRDARRR